MQQLPADQGNQPCQGVIEVPTQLYDKTLYGFAVSIPATYLAVAFWFANGRSYAAYLLACAFVLAVVIAAAWVMAARSSKVLSEARVKAHRMVEQLSNVAAALLPQFEQRFQAPFCRLGKEGEKAAFMVVHGPIVAEP